MPETSELTPSERELCAKAAEGRAAGSALRSATDDALASDGRWGSERQVRAQVLVQLLTGQG
ncbi:MAG: membrane-associated oxidoreductase, partial [Frankiaceae bacterium]